MKTMRIAALTLAVCAAALAVAVAKPAKPSPKPAPVPVATTPAPVDPAYMWNLSDLYPSPEAWTAERARVKATVDGFDKYKGYLGQERQGHAGRARRLLRRPARRCPPRRLRRPESG